MRRRAQRAGAGGRAARRPAWSRRRRGRRNLGGAGQALRPEGRAPNGAPRTASPDTPHRVVPTPGPASRGLTQAVEAERAIVQEVADVPRTGRHGAEGVRTARRERVEAGGQQEDEQRPVVGLRPEARAPREHQQTPQEVPAAARAQAAAQSRNFRLPPAAARAPALGAPSRG